MTEVWLALIDLVKTAAVVLAPVFLAYIAWQQRKQATEVRQVKEDLRDTNAVQSDKLDSMAKVNNATHALVNSAMGVQLKLTALALGRVADMTHSPADVRAADEAERLYEEHAAKQAAADAAKGV